MITANEARNNVIEYNNCKVVKELIVGYANNVIEIVAPDILRNSKRGITGLMKNISFDLACIQNNKFNLNDFFDLLEREIQVRFTSYGYTVYITRDRKRESVLSDRMNESESGTMYGTVQWHFLISW